MTILDEILDHKRAEVAELRETDAFRALEDRAVSWADPVRGFRAALLAGEFPRVIAEIKRRSPSRGEIRPDFDPVACARAYQEGGAAALSVLTDAHYFGGHVDFLEAVRNAVPLPLLRKDFIVDPLQIDEARVCGADAVLLIVAAFPGPSGASRLAALREHAVERSLDVLVEVHDEAELEVALEIGADLVGVNNRDLRTFEVDLAVTERLAPRVTPETVLVAESGIFDAGDIARLRDCGARAFLVGESLMREADLVGALYRLRGTM
ncbi:MAG: indole-3-glycerol phosphate synthase TrpC [Myxococcota bacterium]|nr:indole-3-glycerol phosphate synthase TrpC [Myxococcota bacterium]